MRRLGREQGHGTQGQAGEPRPARASAQPCMSLSGRHGEILAPGASLRKACSNEIHEFTGPSGRAIHASQPRVFIIHEERFVTAQACVRDDAPAVTQRRPPASGSSWTLEAWSVFDAIGFRLCLLQDTRPVRRQAEAMRLRR